MSTNTDLRGYLYAALFAALIAVLGYVSITLPFSAIPITAQTLAVMLAGSVLKPKHAGLSVLTFLLLGIAGVPVFAGGKAGFNIIAGPSGGYLIGFLVGAIVISLLRGSKNNPFRLGMANAVGGIIVVYAIGVVWLNFATGMGIYQAIIRGALPFILGDVLKVFAATIIGVAVNKQVRHIVQE